ncbi:MAG: hypothetical protein KY397_04410 [Gemmatimonadetes bacterium]|nr:hypothetical protein [Gemmatimonadota bacterium]
MTDLKPISREAIPRALDKVERYRLLNEPAEAESICRDVIRVDPENQKALVLLLLTLTDQFGRGTGVGEARALVGRIEGEYERAYYEGIVCERQGKAMLRDRAPGSDSSAYDWLREAMRAYEKAETLRPEGNDDAILRWNACARLVRDRQLGPRAEDAMEIPIE